jgi:hypothetical protein
MDQLIGSVDNGNLEIDYKINSQIKTDLDIMLSDYLTFHVNRKHDWPVIQNKNASDGIFSYIIEKVSDDVNKLCSEGFSIASIYLSII